MSNKVISVALCFVMLFSLCSITVSAASTYYYLYNVSNVSANSSNTESNFSKYWEYWSQGGSMYSGMRDYGCRVVAQSKLLVECGAASSNVDIFNPDVYFEWANTTKYFEYFDTGSMYEQTQYGGSGAAAVEFANSNGINLKKEGSVALSGTNSVEDAELVMEYINAGYYIILSCTAHQAYVGREASLNAGTPIVLNSWTGYSYRNKNNIYLNNYNDSYSTSKYTAFIYFSSDNTPIISPDGYLYKSLDNDTSNPSFPGKWIRESDSTGSELIGSIPYGEYAVVTKYNSGRKWAYVNYKGVEGWTMLDEELFPYQGLYTCPIVTFNSNGGSVSTSDKKVYINTPYGTLPTPTRTGYTFDGWYTSASGGTLVTASTNVTLTGNQMLYAHWNQSYYTVSYDANGGSGAPESQTGTAGSFIFISGTIPERFLYNFCGWYGDYWDASTYYSPGDEYYGDNITLYALWEAPQSYIACGVEKNSYYVPYPSQKRYYLIEPTYDGKYVFESKGSYDTVARLYDSGGNLLASNDDGGDNYNFKLEYDSFEADKTYYLQYWFYDTTLKGSFSVESYKPYVISYDANGGTGVPENQTKKHRVDVTLSTVIPVKTGYTFKGWSTSSTGNVVYAAGATYSANSDVTLYAVWDEHIPGVPTLNINKTNAYNNEAITFTWNDVQYRDYFEFFIVNADTDERLYVDWNVYDTTYTYTVTTPGNYYAYIAAINDDLRDGGHYFTHGNRVYFTIYDRPTYTITYDANGGTGVPASQTKSYDIDLTLSAIEPIRDGYIFKGWATSKSGSVVYTPGEIYTTNSEITLYACWTLCGDIYNDGKIDIQDMKSLAAFLSNEQASIHALASDLNADGKITLHDLRILFKKLASGE